MNGALTITELLRSASDGDDESLRIVFERLYRDLRQIAVARLRSSASRTLTPTALVHEVFERLMGSQQLNLNDRGHFFACAARAMRMVVVDYARRGSAKKRNRDPVTISIGEGEAPVVDVLDLDRALSELEAVNPRACELVGLRYFVGLTMEEVSETMGISLRTTNREWQKARAFLFARMSADDNSQGHST